MPAGGLSSPGASMGLRSKRQGVGADGLGPRSRTAVAVSFAVVVFATLVLLAVDFYVAAQHLVLGYLLPTIFVAIYYGSTLAVLTSFACGLAAAYFLFPPKYSFYITDLVHVAELGFFLLLASIASKAVSVLMDEAGPR
jgi:K+-sensing histidine kinase KdpD